MRCAHIPTWHKMHSAHIVNFLRLVVSAMCGIKVYRSNLSRGIEGQIFSLNYRSVDFNANGDEHLDCWFICRSSYYGITAGRADILFKKVWVLCKMQWFSLFHCNVKRKWRVCLLVIKYFNNTLFNLFSRRVFFLCT